MFTALCIPDNLPRKEVRTAEDVTSVDASSTADDAALSKEILIDNSATADDSALSMKLVADFNYVRVKFEGETHTIDKRNLPSKEVMARIDDPHDSVYTV